MIKPRATAKRKEYQTTTQVPTLPKRYLTPFLPSTTNGHE